MLEELLAVGAQIVSGSVIYNKQAIGRMTSKGFQPLDGAENLINLALNTVNVEVVDVDEAKQQTKRGRKKAEPPALAATPDSNSAADDLIGELLGDSGP